jgi:hypothetical protein
MVTEGTEIAESDGCSARVTGGWQRELAWLGGRTGAGAGSARIKIPITHCFRSAVQLVPSRQKCISNSSLSSLLLQVPPELRHYRRSSS